MEVIKKLAERDMTFIVFKIQRSLLKQISTNFFVVKDPLL